jgi:hypothetical protein
MISSSLDDYSWPAQPAVSGFPGVGYRQLHIAHPANRPRARPRSRKLLGVAGRPLSNQIELASNHSGRNEPFEDEHEDDLVAAPPRYVICG